MHRHLFGEKQRLTVKFMFCNLSKCTLIFQRYTVIFCRREPIFHPVSTILSKLKLRTVTSKNVPSDLDSLLKIKRDQTGKKSLKMTGENSFLTF